MALCLLQRGLLAPPASSRAAARQQQSDTALRSRVFLANRSVPSSSCVAWDADRSAVGRPRRRVERRVLRAAGPELGAGPVLDKKEKVLEALESLKLVISSLEGGFLAKLPQDLQSDVKDSAFPLSSGPIKRELGELVGGPVLQIGSALESGDSSALMKGASELAIVVPSLEENGRQQFYLGSKLISASRPLIASGEVNLVKLGGALKQCGESLKDGAEEGQAVQGNLSEASRVLKFGDLQVRLTQKRAFIGAGFALAFGILCLNLAMGLGDPTDTTKYASQSLEGPLRLIFTCSAVLAGLNFIGLLVLGVQITSEGEEEG